MAIPDTLKSLVGQWKGTYKLHRSWLETDKQVSECPSSLHLEADKKGTYLTLTYTWQVDGKAEEGTMLLSYVPKPKRMEIGWTDSWHYSDGVFLSKGIQADDDSFPTKGSWEAGGETWGWTIVIAIKEDQLTIKMDNITPQGEADWAVDSTYTRVV